MDSVHQVSIDLSHYFKKLQMVLRSLTMLWSMSTDLDQKGICCSDLRQKSSYSIMTFFYLTKCNTILISSFFQLDLLIGVTYVSSSAVHG